MMGKGLARRDPGFDRRAGGAGGILHLAETKKQRACKNGVFQTILVIGAVLAYNPSRLLIQESDAMPEAMPVEKLSFEAALAELETIVRDLETGRAGLEESIKAYERGVALKSHCEIRLREAQEKIEKISVGPDGAAKTSPFDEE